MCIVCSGEYKYGTKELDCSNCWLLTEIPHIKGLKKLRCNGCLQLTEIPHIKGLKKLRCGNCPLLTEIPRIRSLKTLECYNCPLLTKIPHIEGLEVLDCCKCQLLTEIPHIKGLKNLVCYSCLLLTKIPHIDGLEILRCRNTWLPITTLYSINHDFKNNIARLEKIQKFFKKYLPFRRLRRFVQDIRFTAWFYSPEGPGGKNAVRRLENKQNFKNENNLKHNNIT